MPELFTLECKIDSLKLECLKLAVSNPGARDPLMLAKEYHEWISEADEAEFGNADLVSFGEYLLSDARKETIGTTSMTHEESLKSVHHADIENWLTKRK